MCQGLTVSEHRARTGAYSASDRYGCLIVTLSFKVQCPGKHSMLVRQRSSYLLWSLSAQSTHPDTRPSLLIAETFV